MLTRRNFLTTAAAVAAAGATSPVFAQAGYPDHPIRIIVGYAAGGGVDIVARLLSEPMKQALGQTVIVENRTGASAMIASNTVAKAALVTGDRKLQALTNYQGVKIVTPRTFLDVLESGNEGDE